MPIPGHRHYAAMLAARAEGITMQAVGDRFGVSRERVRQIIGNRGRVAPRDLTGHRHHWLTVVDGTTAPLITVRCKCGTVKEVPRSYVCSNSGTYSCGCYRLTQGHKWGVSMRKLSDADVRKLRRWRDNGWTFKALGAHFGISHMYAWQLYNRWRGKRADA